MTYSAANLLIEILADHWNVTTIFGIPGNGIIGIMEALRLHQNRVQFVQARHEEAAALMACGYAKLTGKLGVCLASSGPGGIHLLNGLYDAKLDGVPVLAITGMPSHQKIDTFSYQDVCLDRLFQDVSVYSARAMGADHVEPILHLACRSALAKKSVAHISIPADFQTLPVKRQGKIRHTHVAEISEKPSSSDTFLFREDLHIAAEILNTGKKIAILAGLGATQASEELLELAEILGAPIVKSLLGKAVVPDDSVYSVGCLGWVGSIPAKHAMERCDTLLMVGTSFPYAEFLPKTSRTRTIQIERTLERIALHYPIDLALHGDSSQILKALIPLLNRNLHRDFLEGLQDEMELWWKQIESQGRRTSVPMKPHVPAWELGKRLDSQSIITCDSGTAATWVARQIPARRGQHFAFSGTLGTMGNALSYGIAAQIAYPDRLVTALVGDGSLSMLMGELSTCAKYKLPVKILVFKNNELGLTHWEQKVIAGNPPYGCQLQPIDFVQVAEACGLKAFSITSSENCGPLLEQGLNERGPILFECVVDPSEYPIPEM